MVDHGALHRAFDDYTRWLLHPDRIEIGTVLYRLADQAVEVLEAAGAGVSIARDGDLAFVSATDADVAAVEEHQVRTRQGPCHEAFDTGQPVVVADLEHDPRWPAYRREALGHGVRAVMGVPMPVDEVRIGALNVYRRDTHRWTDEQIDVGVMLANMASGYVLNARRLEESTTLADQLQHALDSRVVIEQAKGILAERHRISPSEAFELLRARSRNTNQRLHVIAGRVVDPADDPATPPDPQSD